MPRLVFIGSRSTLSRRPLSADPQDRVADLGAAVAVLERGAVRRDGRLARDRAQQVRAARA